MPDYKGTSHSDGFGIFNKISEEEFDVPNKNYLRLFMLNTENKLLDGAPDENQINCLGNFAMIGSEANSSGSNWSPKTKLDHYLDPTGKIRQISIASIKFMIMMQRCKDNQDRREPGREWVFEDIKNHQERMLKMMFK